MKWPSAARALALFCIAAVVGRQFPDTLNGSLTYAPAFLILGTLGLYHYRRPTASRLSLPAAAVLFAHTASSTTQCAIRSR